MANRAWMNFGHFYANLTSPDLVSCNFIVDSTNGNGLGIRSLKSNGYVKNVFMHTSATPGQTIPGQGIVNPNPAAGYILVQMADNYARSIIGLSNLVSPLSGTNLPITSGLVVGNPYVITVLGTSTAADWLAIGLPAGLVPTVGQSFIAIAAGSGSGSGMVQAPSNSGIETIETIGDPNQSSGPQGVSNQGAWFLLQCLKADVLTAPANGTTICLSSLLDSSSVNVDGL
jgi:hypothetical protein